MMSEIVDRFIHKFGRLPTETDPDYLEMLRMSKYQISDVPMYKPHKCANCGSSKDDGRRYVDFGLEVDWYGTVFICGFCLLDVSKAMGLFGVLESEISRLAEENKKLQEERLTTEELRVRAVVAFKGFRDYYDSLLTAGNYTNTDSTPSVDSTAISEITPESASEPIVDPPKPRATKSTPSARRANIPSIAELLNESGGGK
jgi:hypothetical protein